MCSFYRINAWEDVYEKSQFKRAKTHHWVAMPIKHDGAGYRRITIQKDPCELFAAWCLIVQVAAKCPTRGLLVDSEQNAIDSESMAIKTGFPVEIFDRAFDFFSSEKMKWLVLHSEQNAKHSECAPSELKNAPSETVKNGFTPSETQNTRSENTHSTVQDRTEQNNTVYHEARSVPKEGGIRKDENRHGARDENHDFGNISILHRPEMAEKVKLESFEDFMRADVVSIACTLADWWPDRSGKSGPAAGFFCKQLKSLASRLGDAKACSIIREDLFRFWSELRHGEVVSNPSAAITARVKAIC